ncbi:MAG TPA: cupredoxin family copper-binding protein [Terriglobales bacterium]|jgi:plastocyanin
MPRIRSVAVLAALASVALLWSLRSHASEPQSAAGASAVTIDNFTFAPNVLTVKTGTRITWTNRDDIPHTVVGDNQEFKSKPLDTDGTFSFTPTKPGAYSYFCSLHPKMTGKVVVEQ